MELRLVTFDRCFPDANPNPKPEFAPNSYKTLTLARTKFAHADTDRRLM